MSEVIVESNPKRAAHAIIDTLAGSLAGMVGLIVGSPFAVVKVRMQNQSTSSTTTKVKILPTIHTAWKNEGLLAFYKGLGPPLGGEAVLNSVWFGTFAFVSKLLQSDRNVNLTFAQGCLAGAASGVTGSFVYSPVDLIKVRTQMSMERGNLRKKPLQIIKQIYTEEGLGGFTRGLGVTILREVPSMTLYFGLYNSLKQLLTPTNGPIPVWGQILAGGSAGAMSWASIYPIDVVKTRLQSTSEFSSVRGCVMMMLRREGVGSFFQGLSPCLVRSFPVNATIFFVYERIVKGSLMLTG